MNEKEKLIAEGILCRECGEFVDDEPQAVLARERSPLRPRLCPTCAKQMPLLPEDE